MRLGRAEQHAVRDYDRGAPADFQHTDEQRQEQQLGFLCLAELQQVGRHDVGVKAALERWISEYQAVLVAVGVLVTQAVAVLYVRVVYAVGHHVHGADAQHGAIHVEAVEHVVHVVILLLTVEEDLILAVLLEILPGGDEEAGSAAGWVYVPADIDTIEKAFSGG